MIKVKLDLKNLTDAEFIDLMRLVVTRMTGNASFPAPSPDLTTLTTNASTLETAIGQRDALLSQAQQMTISIRALRDTGEIALTSEASYVETQANRPGTNPAVTPEEIITSAGMGVQEGPSPIGPMPKVDGLFATQGDSEGEIDLQWNPIKRGLRSYVMELSEDPAGQTGWRMAKVETRSRATMDGLTSGKRYWFRVAAVGAAGQGPFSEPATKVAP